jgi:hypothetical protein
MYPLNDNDLDRLSREAAEQYDVDQSTSGWEALETRLNKELPLKEEKERRRFLFWLFFIVLLAGGSLWWMMSGGNNDSKNNNPSANIVSPNPGIAQDQTKTIIDKQPVQQSAAPAAGQAAVSPQQNTSDDQSKSSPLTENKAVNPGTGKEPVTGKEAANAVISDKIITKDKNRKGNYTDLLPATAVGRKKKKASDLVIAGNNNYSDKTSTSKTGTNNPSRKKGNRQQDIANDNRKPVADKDKLAVARGQEDKEGKKEVVTDQVKESVAKDQTITPDTNKPVDTAAVAKTSPVLPQAVAKDSAAIAKDSPAIAKKPVDKKNNKKVRGFEIGIIGGPDKSNVKFTHSAEIGYNIGLQLGYRFSNRWSINTGLLYTKKNYKADGKDVAKYGWYANPAVDVYAMEGYCSMLDIPLNVRYDFSVTPKNRFFASTGLSTYIMKNEDYDYYWKYGATNGTSNWTSSKGGAGDSTYFFSILNISAGFERSLNKHFSIQAEPYLKLPLNQLGHAKLNLSSYGIYFSFKYRIAK